jgi:small conductance mechanosensitive channel
MSSLLLEWIPLNILLFLTTLIFSILIGYIFSVLVRRSLGKVNPLLSEMLSRYGSWTIYLVGLLFALELLNLRLEAILVFLVLIGVLVVIGLRDFLPNLFARQFIETYKPYKIGDWIMINDQVGRVIDINDLYTSVLTLNHERVYIPNSTMLKEKIINITASNGIEVNIDFAIRYNENISRVLQQILKAIQDDVQEEGIEEPDIIVREIRGDIIHARIKFRLLNPQRLEDARNRVLREVLKVLSTQGKT